MESGIPRPRRKRAWPIVVGTAVVAVILWQVMASERRARTRETVDLHAARIGEYIAARAKTRIFLPFSLTGGSKELLLGRVDRLLPRRPGYVAFSWLDADFRVEWTRVLEGYEAKLDFDHLRDEQVRAKIWLDLKQGRASHTRSDAIKGAKGFHVIIPLPTKEEPEGFLVVTVQADPFFQAIFDPMVEAEDFSVAVFDGAEQIYLHDRRQSESSENRQTWLSEQTFDLLGADWRLEVWPTEAWLASTWSRLPEAVLGFGLLTALMLGTILHLVQKSSLRAQEAELARRQVQGKNQELALALGAAREATELKGRFMAVMSHEIRTPMTGVLGMTDLLLCTKLDEEQREYAQAVKSSAESLLGVINKVLDYSKIEAGKMEIESFPFDLWATVRGVGTLLYPRAHAKGLEMESYIDPQVPKWVLGDPVRVRQVLTNLVGNAVKFTERGRVTVRVEPVRESGDTHTIRFTVQDTGIGIPKNQLGQIFQDFTQADSSMTRRYGGTGLGLSISKHLVEMMGGEMGCESEEGRGSTFWFSIPLGKTPALEPASEPAESPPAPTSA